MAIFKTITQGGQVHIHQLRMLKQILTAGLVVALISGGGTFAWKSYTLPAYAWRITYEVYWARFMLVSTPDTKHKSLSQLYTPPKGSPYYRKCLNVLQDPLLKKVMGRVERYLTQAAYKSLEFSGYAFFAIMMLWFFFGLAQKRIHHQRGNTLVPWRTLRRLLKRTDQASDIRLGKLPLLKHEETSHIMITGTTGSGKTNAFHSLLPQIRRRKNRAIIIDLTGDYVSRYYDETRDFLLNPLDVRSLVWSPWADCSLDSHYDILAESIIQPKKTSADPFWDTASRAVLKTALRKFAYQEDYDIQKLTDFLLSSSHKEFEEFYRGTESAAHASKNNDKTTYSIRSVLSSQIEGFRQLESTKNPFSIRKWVMDEDTSWVPDSSGTTARGSWLFITARADQRKTLIPLISAWVDIAMNALMVLPEDLNRRLWFIMDELTALQKLTCLQGGLAEVRKYGGCLLVGFQSKPQLEEIYGEKSAAAMLDLFNTNIFFRCKEPSTQQWVSKMLGDKEETEPTENISFGANSLRDGVSLSRHTRQKSLIMPSELSLLNKLECFIKFPGDYPCTKLQMKIQRSFFKKTQAFILKPERKREYAENAVENSKIKREILI